MVPPIVSVAFPFPSLVTVIVMVAPDATVSVGTASLTKQ
jgi:hypothetical protein